MWLHTGGGGSGHYKQVCTESWLWRKKIPCHARESNLCQQHTSLTLYQLSYIPTASSADSCSWNLNSSQNPWGNIKQNPKLQVLILNSSTTWAKPVFEKPSYLKDFSAVEYTLQLKKLVPRSSRTMRSLPDHRAEMQTELVWTILLFISLAKPSCKAQWKGEADMADRKRGGKTTSGNGQAWSLPSPRGQWRREKWRKLVVKSSMVPQWPSTVKG